MKTNVAAVVVLYNPEKNFIQNIHTYAGYVSLLIIVDNSETPDLSFYSSLENEFNVKFIIYHDNKGIGKAINDAAEFAWKNGYNWLLTMDQDSTFEKSMIEKYLVSFNEIPAKEMIAVIGPSYSNKANPEVAGKIRSVTSLITSGSLVNLSILNETGGYDENLFIDEVDHEYCYRAKSKGFSILKLEDIFMQHALGRSKYVTTILGKKNMLKSLHAPVRLYYIVRNAGFVIAKYKKFFPEEMKARRRDVLVRIKNNFLYGNNRLAVLKYVIRGFIDHKRNRFGKYR